MNSRKQHIVGDALFFLQIFFAFSMGFSQAWQMLQSTEGIILTWFAFWGFFLLINLKLSYQAHLVHPSRISKQTLIVYAVWTLIMGLNIAVFLWQDSTLWKEVDTLTACLAAAGIAILFVVSLVKKLPLSDPILRGYLALVFKAMPQVTLAYSIWLDGGEGLSVVAVIVGHITICTRLGQIFLSVREAAWDRNRIGSLISELGNEASMVVLTVAWLLK